MAANCEANIVVVENQAQLSKILQVRSSTGQRVHQTVGALIMSALSLRPTPGEGPAASPEGHRAVQGAAAAEGVVPVLSRSSPSTPRLPLSESVPLTNLCLFLQWADFLKMGEDMTDQELNAVIGSLRANECCTLIYTSGTTGNPKGVMLSHDNVSADTQRPRPCKSGVRFCWIFTSGAR